MKMFTVYPDQRRFNIFVLKRTPFWGCRAGNRTQGHLTAARRLLDHSSICFAIILKGPDDNKTLMECRFAIGDYMDITITPPNSRMDRMDYGRRNFGGGDRYVRKSTSFCSVRIRIWIGP